MAQRSPEAEDRCAHHGAEERGRRCDSAHTCRPTGTTTGPASIGVAIEEAATGGRGAGLRGGLGQRRGDPAPRRRRGTVEGGQVIEPLVTLATLVHLVPRLTLGTAVLVLPQRNAILVAKQAAALHLLSGGRLVLGVGIGWRAEEFALLGADFAHRAAATDEAIEVLRTLWREPVAVLPRPVPPLRRGQHAAAPARRRAADLDRRQQPRRRSGGRPGTATAGCPSAWTSTPSAPAWPRCGS